MSMHARGITGLLICLVSMLWHHDGAAASNWSQLGIGLNGRAVSSLAADPGDYERLAAVSGGELYTSTTGGLIWDHQEVPGLITAVAYDPSRTGRLWVGTSDRCVLSRESGGFAWQTYHSTGNCFVTALRPTRDGVFYLTLDGGGSKVNRLIDDDTNYSLVYTGARPYNLAAEADGDRLYVAGDNELSRSDDDGETWQRLALPSGTGCCIATILADGDNLWMIAGGQLVLSRTDGDGWLAIGERASARYGFGRMAAHGDTAYFTMAYDGNVAPDVVTEADTPERGLGLGTFASDLAVSDGWLIAATGDGIWRYGTHLASVAKRMRPVIVIPGLAGSWPKEYGLAGELVLDPILHTYDGLLARLRAAGYNELDNTLVPFPYQWRQDNTISAQQLSEVVSRTVAACKCGKVDIVAHSMGGLVARQYIEGGSYHNDVARLVEVATPNRGSPLAYLVWEAAKLSDNSFDVAQGALARLMIELVRFEGLSKHYASVTDYIRLGIPSVEQLLPDTSYITGRTYPQSYPANHFLESLNSTTNLTALRRRVKLYVVGSQAKDTISTLDVLEPHPGFHSWPDGEESVRRIGQGDGTVPFSSLNGLHQANVLTDADHGEIVTTAADKIIAYLLGDVPDEAYDTTVPNVAQLKVTAKQTATATKPKKTVLIATKAGSKLKVISKAKTKASTQTYHASDEHGDYVIIVPGPDDSGGSISVSVDPDESTPIEVAETSDEDTDPGSTGDATNAPSQVAATETTITDTTGPTEIEITYGDGGVGLHGPEASSSSTSLGSLLGSTPSATGMPQPTILVVDRSTQSLSSTPRSVRPQPVAVRSLPALAAARPVTTRSMTRPLAGTGRLKAPIWPIFAIGLEFGLLVWLALVWFWLLLTRRLKRSADRTSVPTLSVVHHRNDADRDR